MIGIILSVVFGILGIGATYLFYRKTIKIKKLLFSIDSSVLISNSLNKYTNLKITYGDQDIKSLCNSIIKIRNTGTDNIEPSDLYKDRPIIIEISEPLIFNNDEYKIECSNKDSSVSLVSIDEKTLRVDFEILNPKDVITIEMLHNDDIFMDGKLKNGKIDNSYKKEEKINNTVNTNTYVNYEDKYYDTQISFINIMVKILIILSLLVFTILLIFDWFNEPSSDGNFIYIFLPIVILMLLSLVDKLK